MCSAGDWVGVDIKKVGVEWGNGHVSAIGGMTRAERIL